MADTSVPTREKILEIAGAMPATPRVFGELGRLLRDGNTPLEQIAVLVKHDPALSAHLIRASNSAVHRGERSAGTVEEAVSRLGFREIFDQAGYVASRQMAERALLYYGIEAAQLREHMVRTAFMCELLAAECEIDPRLAYTAGLVRPLGLFVYDRLAARWPGLQKFHPAHHRNYDEWEARAFGMGNCEVAAMVLRNWRFPEEIVLAIRYHYLTGEVDATQRLTCLLNLACGLMADAGHGLIGEASHWGITTQKLEIMGLNAKKVRALVAKADEQFAGFQERMEGKPGAGANEKKQVRAPVISRDSCDFPPQARVVGQNDETPVHTTDAAAEVTTAAPLDFTTFMRNYQDMVYSTAVRLIGNETQAEDIAQEVFIKAHEHFENLRTSPSAGGWLKTVATNLSLNHITRYKKRWSFFSDLVRKSDEGEEREVEFAAPDTFFAGVDSSERREWVERALEKLPDHQRVPLVLFHFEDMPYEDIAKKTRVSLSKVKTDILRGREALAKILMRSGSTHEKFQTS
jgi:RNA polymerase sigma factor (sigma-70 family)